MERSYGKCRDQRLQLCSAVVQGLDDDAVPWSAISEARTALLAGPRLLADGNAILSDPTMYVLQDGSGSPTIWFGYVRLDYGIWVLSRAARSWSPETYRLVRWN